MGDISFTLSVAYGKHTVQSRRDLWDHLRFIHSTNIHPWIWGGDFNTITSLQDKLGGASPQPRAMEDFNSCIHDCRMAPVVTSGNRFTWCNNMVGTRRTWKILDRVLQSSDLLLLGGLSAQTLHRSFSDHSPIILSWGTNLFSGPRLWRYQRMWSHHDSFQDLVHQQWQITHAQFPIVDICIKLKTLRSSLKQWNHSTFGNIFTQKVSLEAEINQLEASLQASWCPSIHAQLLSSKSRWKEISIREEIFWKQKSRIKWLKEGDANSKFFHGIVRSRTDQVNISSIKGPNNEDLNGHETIHNATIAYFSALFSSEPHQLQESLLNLIPIKISPVNNSSLTCPFNLEELHLAAKSIPVDSAAGMDGFSAPFFTSTWHIIGPSVLLVANEFILSKKLPEAITHTLLILIPKKTPIVSLNDFRPISLCTTLYKIIAKALCARLAPLLPNIISPNQGAFVQGRGIADNIGLAQEICRELDKSAKHPNIVLNLDMHKAYDRLEWDFIWSVLSRFGFSMEWIDLMKACICHCHYSVVF